MTSFIPIFPLGIVVFPSEVLNLHIFEERYKQLIQECFAEAKPFGIPTVLDKGVAEMGTELKITEIVEVYEDGKMDVRAQGTNVFRILEVVQSIPEKLYSGAIVNYLDNIQTNNVYIQQKVMEGVRKLHDTLLINKNYKKPDDQITSFDIAHHVGFSLEEEYEMLSLQFEVQRLEFINRHLTKVLSVVYSLDSLKERIQLNGHFRHLKGFNL